MNEIFKIEDLRWRPYPARPLGSQKYIDLSDEDKSRMSDEKRKIAEECSSKYVGSLTEHRLWQSGNYALLKRMEKQGNPKAKELIQNHESMERNINSLTNNIAFRSSQYTPGGQLHTDDRKMWKEEECVVLAETR